MVIAKSSAFRDMPLRRTHSGHAPLRLARPSGSPIDGSLVAIERSYDDAGRLHSVRSRSSDSGNPVVNEVEFAYTPLWPVDRLPVRRVHRTWGTPADGRRSTGPHTQATSRQSSDPVPAIRGPPRLRDSSKPPASLNDRMPTPRPDVPTPRRCTPPSPRHRGSRRRPTARTIGPG